jgi:hypothetical protein
MNTIMSTLVDIVSAFLKPLSRMSSGPNLHAYFDRLSYGLIRPGCLLDNYPGGGDLTDEVDRTTASMQSKCLITRMDSCDDSWCLSVA